MPNHRDLAVLDAADQVVDEVNRLIDTSPRRLIYAAQLRDAAQSVSANIAEGFGRGKGPERNHKLRVARGEAEKAIRHLRSNLTSERIAERTYWPIRNRLVTISKMLSSLLAA